MVTGQFVILLSNILIAFQVNVGFQNGPITKVTLIHGGIGVVWL